MASMIGSPFLWESGPQVRDDDCPVFFETIEVFPYRLLPPLRLFHNFLDRNTCTTGEGTQFVQDCFSPLLAGRLSATGTTCTRNVPKENFCHGVLPPFDGVSITVKFSHQVSLHADKLITGDTGFA